MACGPGASVAGASGGKDTVDVLCSDAAVAGAKIEPADGSDVVWAGVGCGRWFDRSELLGHHMDVSIVQDKVGCAVGIEEVTAEEGQGLKAGEVKGGVGAERLGETGTRGGGADTALCRPVEVERDLMTAENLGGEAVELGLGE